jgi:hypothetical protein
VQQTRLPIVVKPRIGLNGLGCSIARTLTELEAIHRRSPNPAGTLYETFIEGSSRNYTAVIGPDSAERDMTYRTLHRDGLAGSSIQVACQEDDELTEIGRRLATALPCQGLLNVDAIRDQSGRYWIHDVNLRVWGSFFATRSVGLDLVAAYFRWLSDQSRALSGNPERLVRVFPNYFKTAVRSKRPLMLLSTLCADVHRYRRWLGMRYVLFEFRRVPFIRLPRWRTASKMRFGPAGAAILATIGSFIGSRLAYVRSRPSTVPYEPLQEHRRPRTAQPEMQAHSGPNFEGGAAPGIFRAAQRRGAEK